MAASANLPVYGINILLFSDSVSIVTNKQYSLIKGAYEMRFKKYITDLPQLLTTKTMP